MNSVFANLFLLLQTKLESIVTTGNTPVQAFRMIDFDYGQLEEQTPPLTYPAILIDFNKMIATDLGENCKMYEGTISFKIIFDPYSETSSITNINYRKMGLQYLELEQQVVYALDGWCPDDTTDVYSPLCFITTETNRLRPDLTLRVREVICSANIEDTGNKIATTLTPVTPVFEPEII